MESTSPRPSVEAVVLAGGKGTRLAPLTEDTPKPCLKLLGKTVLQAVLERIRDCGISKARVTTLYLPWQVEAVGSPGGNLSVEYVREKRPLGTAGAVRNAYTGESDTVLVLSGDGAFSFDLKKALNFHYEKNADVTIVTHQTENPLDYGVVLSDDDGRIRRFAEKPPWSRVVSGSVNTGIYLFKKEILQRIPPDTEYDFSARLFPLLLAANAELYAYEADGVWYDIGNLDEYYAAVCACLDGKLPGFDTDGLSPEELKACGVEFETPVYVSRKAILGKGIRLGAYTCIGEKAVISDGCDIAQSVISQEVMLGGGCGIYGTLIGRGARLGENCVTSEGCAIGGGALAKDSVILPKYSFVHSGVTVAGNDFPARRISRKENVVFSDEGIRCDKERTNPEYYLRIGRVAAAALSGKKSGAGCRIGFMCDVSASRRVKQTILCGVASAGVRSYDFGCGFEALARYAAMRFITDAVIYVARDENAYTVRIFDSAGLVADSAFEHAFSTLFYSVGDYREPEQFFETDTFHDLWSLYYSDLIRYCQTLLPPDGLRGFVCRVSDGEEIAAYSPAHTALCALAELGADLQKTHVQEENEQNGRPVPVFRPDKNGTALSFSLGRKSFDPYHTTALLIENMPLIASSPLYLSGEWPQTYRTLAEKKRLSYKNYAESNHSAVGMTGRQRLEQLWLTDAVYQTLSIAALLKKDALGEKPDESFPEFAVLTRFIDTNANRAGVMERLAKLAAKQSAGNVEAENEHDGVQLTFAEGKVTVIPGKAAGFRMISEAKNAEAAKELCDSVEEYLT